MKIMDVTTKSTDELFEMLAWIEDRARYRRICKMTRATDYAEECAMENAVCGELYRRGF